MTVPLWLASFMDENGTGKSPSRPFAHDSEPHDTVVDDPDLPFVNAIRLGDDTAFRTVWERYHAPLADFAARYVRSADIAEDVVQHVFCTLWCDRATFRIHRTLAAYLYAAVRHRAWNVIKHARVVERHAKIELDDPAQARNLGELAVDTDELLAEASRLLTTLPARTREVFLMHREDGLAPSQITAVLGIAPQTVYNQLARATKTLAEGLERWRREQA